MNNCYVYSQAVEQRCNADFPRYNVLARAVVASLQRPNSTASDDSRSSPLPSSPLTLRHTVTMPSISSLLSADPATLLDVRQDIYPAYWVRLRQWQREPTEQRANSVREHAPAYAAALTKEVRGKRGRLSVTHRASPGALTFQGLSTVGTTGQAVGTVIGVRQLDIPIDVKVGAARLSSLLALGNLGYSFYKWHSGQPAQDEQQGLTWKASPELTLPTRYEDS
jgi:hypothetical protein